MTRGAAQAAGGLLWRETDGLVEIALVHRPEHQDWSLPKGTPAPGEHPLMAACRAVAAQTGATPVAGARLPSVTYQVLTSEGSADKTVAYWAMNARGEPASTSAEDVDAEDVDQVRWAALDAAAEALSYRRDREVVAAFSALARPLSTVLLASHAPADEASAWDGPDVTRPLGSAGEAAAGRLCRLLGCFAPARVLSATPRRCVQTVTPLTARAVEIESDIVFDSDSHARTAELASERVRELAQQARGGAAAICGPGEMVSDTVAMLADTDGLHMPTVATSAGCAWALCFSGPRLVAADYLAP
ncbi:MAG: NUDIX domain-containing protein [Micromonosporaceae bacterium]